MTGSLDSQREMCTLHTAQTPFNATIKCKTGRTHLHQVTPGQNRYKGHVYRRDA